MPLIFLEQLPLPSLQSYVTVSALLFVSSGLYSINVIRSNGVAVEEDSLDVYEFMSQSSFCFWVRFPIFIKPGTESELRSYVFLNGCSVQFVLCFFFFSQIWTWHIAVYSCLGKLFKELCSEIYGPLRCRYGKHWYCNIPEYSFTICRSKLRLGCRWRVSIRCYCPETERGLLPRNVVVPFSFETAKFKL